MNGTKIVSLNRYPSPPDSTFAQAIRRRPKANRKSNISWEAKIAVKIDLHSSSPSPATASASSSPAASGASATLAFSFSVPLPTTAAASSSSSAPPASSSNSSSGSSLSSSPSPSASSSGSSWAGAVFAFFAGGALSDGKMPCKQSEGHWFARHGLETLYLQLEPRHPLPAPRRLRNHPRPPRR